VCVCENKYHCMLKWQWYQNSYPAKFNANKCDFGAFAKKEKESMTHLFIQCEFFSLSCGGRCLKWWDLKLSFHNQVVPNFLQFRGLVQCGAKKIKRVMWQSFWFAAVWTIWKCINEMIFSKKKWVAENVGAGANSFAAVDHLLGKFQYSFSCWITTLKACLDIWWYYALPTRDIFCVDIMFWDLLMRGCFRIGGVAGVWWL